MGIGNLLRADDAIGIIAAEKIGEKFRNIDVITLEALTIDILNRIRGYRQVIIIDAVDQAKPGEIVVLDAYNLPSYNFISSHSMDLPTILNLGKALIPDEMPEKIHLIGVGISDTSLGGECTSQVLNVIPKILCIIKKILMHQKI